MRAADTIRRARLSSIAMADDSIDEFYITMYRARARCYDEARRENLWGYPDSAQAYTAMAEEMYACIMWIAKMISDDKARYRFPVKRKGRLSCCTHIHHESAGAESNTVPEKSLS